MIDFSVTVLGSGSAVPTSWHNPSSQLIDYNGRQFLIDCGEGTQMQMIKYQVRRKNLDHIFISHLHGDHFYGLIGMINSFHLMRREKPLNIFGSADLEKLIDFQLKITNTRLYYPIVFHSLENATDTLYEDKFLSIHAFPLKHSIPVWGFLIREKESRRRIDKTFINEYKPSSEDLADIAAGGDFVTTAGKLLKHGEITLEPHKQRSYAYCSDTVFLKSTADHVQGVDLLYHESTFGNDNEKLAAQTLHSTAAQAATVAKEARVGRLLIGHYSARYHELDSLLQEAKTVFPDSFLSIEGETYPID